MAPPPSSEREKKIKQKKIKTENGYRNKTDVSSVEQQAQLLNQNSESNLPVMIPFFSTGSSQLTRRDVSRISVKLRCPTGPGTEKKIHKHRRDGDDDKMPPGLPLPKAAFQHIVLHRCLFITPTAD